MGRDKAFIEIGGTPIIQRIYKILKKIFREIIIVANQRECYLSFKAKIVSDLIPNYGALGGLYTGLFHASYPYSFCVACDMPFLKEPLIHFLAQQTKGYDAIVPKTADGLQPLHAIYSKQCLPSIKHLIETGGFKITDFYSMVNTKIIEESEFIHLDKNKESFININTPRELRLWGEKKKAC